MLESQIRNCSLHLLLQPDDIIMLSIRGVLLDVAKQYDQAILDFNKLIEQQPGVQNNYFLRAFTYCNKQEYKLALMDFRKAHHITESNIQGIQASNIPQMICSLANARGRVIAQIEWSIRKDRLKEKYGFSWDASLS